MTRDELRKRLIDAGLPEEVVDVKLKSLSDSDLARMKDIPVALVEDFGSEGGKDGENEDSGASKIYEMNMDDLVGAFSKAVVDVLKDAEIGVTETELEADVPGLDELLAEVRAVKEQLEQQNAVLGELLKDEDARIKDKLGDLSAAQRLRIRYTAGSSQAAQDKDKGEELPTTGDAVIDGSGKAYESITAMLYGG